MTDTELHDFRDRAVAAMQRILQTPIPPEPLVIPGLPVAIKLPSVNLIIAVGDNEPPLDAEKLKAIATAQGCNVVCLYADPVDTERGILFELVIHQRREVVHYEKYELWLGLGYDSVFFVPRGQLHDDAVIAKRGNLAPARRDPFRDLNERQIGALKGRDQLHRLVWGASG